MSTLILCGQTESETPEYLTAEKGLIRDLREKFQLPENGKVEVFRFATLPDSQDLPAIETFSTELIHLTGQGEAEYETEHRTRGGFPFLVIFIPADQSQAERIEATLEPVQNKPVANRKLWLIPVYSLGVLILLVGIYYGAGLILTGQVQAGYQDHDCEQVLSLSDPTEKLYPVSIAPFVTEALDTATECTVYTEAVNHFEQGKWKQAYEGYLKYMRAYPDGEFYPDAREGGGQSLLAWAKERYRAKDHQTAIEKLKAILREFSKTTCTQEATNLIPEVYVDWGVGRRNKGEFPAAEDTFQDFHEWATNIHNDQFVYSADLELAQTYLDWAMSLREENEFEEADVKCKLAIETDPAPQSQDGPAAQAAEALPGLHQEWGEYLMERRRGEEAIDHFQLAVKYSQPEDKAEAQDTLASAHLEWSTQLVRSEDFYGALDQIATAQETANSQAIKNLADSAHTKTLADFSQSSGAQATQLIKDMSESFCDSGKAIDTLPIVGIDENAIRFYPDGVNVTLSDKVLARTPGSLHYVVCIKQETRKLQTCPYTSSSGMFYVERRRYHWVVKLYNVLTGKIYTNKDIAGAYPKTCPAREWFSLSQRTKIYNGDQPKASDLETWLLTLIK